MADDSSQRAAFQFLRDHLASQELFEMQEFIDATGWHKPSTFRTYYNKHFQAFFEQVDASRYRVTDAFWPFVTWRRFRAHVTQVRRVVADYTPLTSRVLIYDFLMPLSNEEHLRMTLDALFYKDRLVSRLRWVDETNLAELFPDAPSGSDEQRQMILDFIEDRFVGYSVTHVDGRFRSAPLLDHPEAADLEQSGRRYLIDETTAVARFMFPYHEDHDLARIRFLFQELFIRSIIQLVSGEEQIWMVESGSDGSGLHIWERADEGEDEDW
jgi:hypothetical protein